MACILDECAWRSSLTSRCLTSLPVKVWWKGVGEKVKDEREYVRACVGGCVPSIAFIHMLYVYVHA